MAVEIGDQVAKLTVAECEEILEATGVDINAPAEMLSFGRRYSALAWWLRFKSGDPVSFDDLLAGPVADVVDILREGTAPANRADRRAAAKSSGKGASPKQTVKPARRRTTGG